MPDDEAIATAVSSISPLVSVQNFKPLQMLSVHLLVCKQALEVAHFLLLPQSVTDYQPMAYSNITQILWCLLLVVTVLKSLIRDQIAILKHKGFAAAFVDESESSDSDIKVGKFLYVYGSPEVLVSSCEWRCALQRNELKERFVTVVLDKAHTVVQ